MRLSGIALTLSALSLAACAPSHIPTTSAISDERVFSAGTVSIAADAKRPGPAFTRDQLGANMLVSVPESGKPAYLPLLENAGIRL
ncbi:MAG TPA: hypothetical protein VK760_06085, partial [Candidatus Acidoferrales bacterium]|nr:hypothetical protein [Candidatus Acidoferrales bacterium]